MCDNKCMRYLGIDYGHKRIGIAISDEGGVMAFPFSRILAKSPAFIVKEIKKIIKKKRIEKIVLGLPITFGGQDSLQTNAVKEFGRYLGKMLQLPIEYENEILSTKMAERGGTVKQKIDSSAAAIILQSYLDRNK